MNDSKSKFNKNGLNRFGMISIIGLKGIPLIKPGDDLGQIIVRAAEEQGIEIRDEDVIVITQKIVSKAEGRLVSLKDVIPSEFAEHVARNMNKDPRLVEVILRETSRIIRMKDRRLIMETKHGFVCANAGVDRSNVEGEDFVSLLPEDPDKSAREIRSRIKELTGKSPAVIITDTWGRPWRLGHIDFAVGIAGMSPFRDYRGQADMFGYTLRVTRMAVADELAAAAELAKGKSEGIPVVIIRGYDYPKGDGSAKDLIRPLERDLFR